MCVLRLISHMRRLHFDLTFVEMREIEIEFVPSFFHSSPPRSDCRLLKVLAGLFEYQTSPSLHTCTIKHISYMFVLIRFLQLFNFPEILQFYSTKFFIQSKKVF